MAPVVLVLATAIAASGGARPVAAAASPVPVPADHVTREIEALEDRLDVALERRDRAALERLVTDAFTWIHAVDGRIDSRAAWLAEAARGMALARQRSARTTFEPALAVYGGHTAVRTSRQRFRFSDPPRETWMRQTLLFVREPDGWRIASGQGTRMYEGPLTDADLYRRYAGEYAIAPGRRLILEWDGDALMATWPNGSRNQTFLASPTDELVASPNLARLQFTLGPDGQPSAVAAVRGTTELWHAQRSPRPQ